MPLLCMILDDMGHKMWFMVRDSLRERVEAAVREASSQYESEIADLDSSAKLGTSRANALEQQNRILAQEVERMRDENFEKTKEVEELRMKEALLKDREREIETLRNKVSQMKTIHEQEIDKLKTQFESMLSSRIVSIRGV